MTLQLLQLSPLSELTANSSGGPHTCKYVVIEHGDKIIALTGLVDDYRYHANLLDAYCQDNLIPTLWVGKPDLLEIVDSGVKILGGGWLNLEPQRQRIVLYGSSKAYGRFDHQRLIAMTSEIDCFPGFSWLVAE